jgi:PEP-CTERM motif
MKIITTLALAATAFSLTASAALISVERSVDSVTFGPGTFPADPDYTPDAFDVPNDVFVWEERVDFANDEDFDLDTDLAVPDTKYGRKGGPGAITYADQSGPTVAAGQIISSYYAYYDPSGAILPQVIVLTFDTPVLGIVTSEAGLVNSDHLRVLSAPYAGNFGLRGFEPTDLASLSDDRLTLTLFVAAGTPGDQIRIITGDTGAIPEPTTMALVGGACLLLALAGRKRRV